MKILATILLLFSQSARASLPICALVNRQADPTRADISYQPRTTLPDGTVIFESLLVPGPGQENGQKRLGVAVLTTKGRVVYVITRFILTDHSLATRYMEMVMRKHLPEDERVAKFYWGGETSTALDPNDPSRIEMRFINPTSGMMTELVDVRNGENLSGTLKAMLITALPGLAENAVDLDYSANNAHLDRYMSEWVKSEYANQHGWGKSYYQLLAEHQDKILALEAKVEAAEREVQRADDAAMAAEEGHFADDGDPIPPAYDQEIERLNQELNRIRDELRWANDSKPKPPNYRHDVWLNQFNPVKSGITLLGMGVRTPEVWRIIDNASPAVIEHLRLMKEDGVVFYDAAGTPVDAIGIATTQLRNLRERGPEHVNEAALTDAIERINLLDTGVREKLIADRSHALDGHVEILQLRGPVVEETVPALRFQHPEPEK